jgi:hypothetical protein
MNLEPRVELQNSSSLAPWADADSRDNAVVRPALGRATVRAEAAHNFNPLARLLGKSR